MTVVLYILYAMVALVFLYAATRLVCRAYYRSADERRKGKQ